MFFSFVLLTYSFNYRHVQPLFVHKLFPNPLPPIMDYGIVYHVYTQDRCEGNPKYIKEVERNSAAVKAKDSQAKIALITNCDISASTANLIDIIVPIHIEDVLNTKEKQWWTRVLYNAYLPFNYSFITDTHVYPCDNRSYSDIFSKFKKSNIDISYSCRVNRGPYASGGAVLSKWGKGSHEFWIRTYKYQVQKHIFDDQSPMMYTLKNYRNKLFTFRWLSSNYFYASHGITEKGVFSGPARCYRSSIVVTGPLRWIHGRPYECEIMNGQNRELIYKPRAWFLSGECNTTARGTKVITSKLEMSKAAYPYAAPELDWKVDYNKKPSSDLYWKYLYFCLAYIIIKVAINYTNILR